MEPWNTISDSWPPAGRRRSVLTCITHIWHGFSRKGSNSMGGVGQAHLTCIGGITVIRPLVCFCKK
jgi:hypothetical protein